MRFVLLLGFWALVALPGPATSSPHLLLGLAVVAAALLVVAAAAGLPASPPRVATRACAPRGRSGSRPLPRLLDPDAAGRPRPRAPAASPVVALR
ncbi:DUF6412 domain-containing protein [Actinoplanes sp. NPDC049548]|uniref:DUF6412 domain-containing protein n=1 Tax=Actinoplanes sp. NPDC049548 TaxID=3155152 RepID=UPI0034485D87